MSRSLEHCAAISAAKKGTGLGNRSALTHGHAKHPAAGTPPSSTYTIWADMKQRCTNPKSPSYKNYGGRGIAVCARWVTFVNFLEDMGERPEGLQLDRIDNDGDYTPENCRWVTREEQRTNKCTCRSCPVHSKVEVLPCSA